MPCMVRLLRRDSLQPAPYTPDSLADAVQYEPTDGIYTVTRTFNRTQTLKLDAHLDRLEDSARRQSIPLILNRPRLREALRSMIRESDFGDVRFRLTVGRADPQTFILSIEPFIPPAPEIYADGVRCVTVHDTARSNPAAKTVDWMHQRRHMTLPAAIYDGFLTDAQGHILEGQSSNFYAVLDGELRTAGEGVLAGIARQIVFDVAPDIIPFRPDAVLVMDISRLDEAFLTSSTRGIIPVIEIDGITIGDGAAGNITRKLQAAYNAWVDAHLEEL